MNNTVSIHPYFKVHEGKIDAFKALLPDFIERTKSEAACLYYHFTIHDDVIHCREAYVGAEGLLTHIGNVGPVLEEAGKISDLIRVEVHGPKEELEQLREPLAGLNPEYFEFLCGVEK